MKSRVNSVEREVNQQMLDTKNEWKWPLAEWLQDTSVKGHFLLYENSVAVVDLVLNDLGRPAGESF